MISDKYIKGMLYQEFTDMVLQNAAVKILNEQEKRVYTYNNYRTGHIGQSLVNQASKISKSSSGAYMQLDYLIDLRFLDMKTTKYGKKKVYGPVYNKPLWGFVYGYVFGTLRYGLTATVQRDIFNVIRESYKIPI
jgi:hypothetical protein